MEPDYVYGDAEREIVKSGYEAIEAVVTGHDMIAKRRLLFYLDWYIDPYYKNDLTNLYEPLKELLQKMELTIYETLLAHGITYSILPEQNRKKCHSYVQEMPFFHRKYTCCRRF